MSARPVLLILTGSFGHGHNSAARNLEAAFTHLLGDQVEIEVIDYFSHVHPRVIPLLQKGYAFAINHAPMIWRLLYRFGDLRNSSTFGYRSTAKQLKRFLEDRKPAIVVSTFPPNSILFELAFTKASDRPFHLSTVITDSISISAMWSRGQSDLLFVTDEESKRIVMQQEGVQEAKIRALGFPIPFTMHSQASALQPPDQVRPKILYLPTTKNTHVKRTLDQLASWVRDHDAEITIVLGQHEARLTGVLQSLHDGLPANRVTVHGWISNLPQLMTEHHLVLTKAGGASVSEALGAQCPLIINYVVPGQEEGNAQLVLQSGCGRRIHNPDELPEALTQTLIESDAATWHRYRAHLSDLDRATASLRIAEDIINDSNLSSKKATASCL